MARPCLLLGFLGVSAQLGGGYRKNGVREWVDDRDECTIKGWAINFLRELTKHVLFVCLALQLVLGNEILISRPSQFD